ncbi:hypothetical protein [Thalassospira sp. TSL5-1]|uniref:hypothetical protein n=1 Tax=Thalassospira sp. TSL5-1 TaxID=1544451 RepID=UPI00093C095C|nr:hypothetical protein [Thalassospira sp. TSL5-1]OKH87706.1 hypothetical protein LF95_13210 [Thalassospira sp. TSL5-1]
MAVSDMSYLAYKELNSDVSFDELDYIHATFLNEKLSFDLAFCFLDLICPSFKEVDGYLFLNLIFSDENYQEHVSAGRSGKDIQVWMNLVGISDIFEGIETSEAVSIASKVAQNWNLIISDRKDLGKGWARVIVDNDEAVYVTLD